MRTTTPLTSWLQFFLGGGERTVPHTSRKSVIGIHTSTGLRSWCLKNSNKARHNISSANMGGLSSGRLGTFAKFLISQSTKAHLATSTFSSFLAQDTRELARTSSVSVVSCTNLIRDGSSEIQFIHSVVFN